MTEHTTTTDQPGPRPPTLTRKQREIREREQLILRVSRDHLLRGGYLGLSMDRVAAEMEYSKGTLYQHFRNKEEIILALGNEALQARTAMFERASTMGENTRQRIAAIGAAAQAFFETAPHFFVVEQIVRASSIWEKTSPERREIMQHCERNCMAIVGGIVHDAVECGELVLDTQTKPEDVVFGLWSINWGAQTIASSSDALDKLGIRSVVGALRECQNRMLDGFDWHPLATEFDYSAHMDKVVQELTSNKEFAAHA